VTKCSHCLWPAEVRCRLHRQHICGRMYCIQLHRYAGGKCEYVDPRRFEWMDLVLAIGGISLAVVATGVAWAHLWRIQ
jgi:hypothetical protein